MHWCDNCEMAPAVDSVELFREENVSASIQVCEDCKVVHALQTDLPDDGE